jgi:hypothetical protein
VFVAVADDRGDKLEVLPFDCQSDAILKESEKPQNRQRYFVLRKSG